MSTSRIFLNQISVVDHAYVNDRGEIVGGSFNPSFIVSGKIDPIENVVVDFSTIKKSIKNLIDQHIWDPVGNGYDHKIWWIEGYSQGTLEKADHADRYIVKTACFTSEFPTDALKIIEPIVGLIPNHSASYIGKSFEDFLTVELSKIYPNVAITVECSNNTEVHLYNKSIPFQYFRYVHGLKDSSSYGCQNIAHGHQSFIQYADEDVIFEIQKELDNAIFINRANIKIDNDEELMISYTTPSRGYFSATYKKDRCKLVILDTETTIEWIAEYIQQKFGISSFYVSEGLSKGCFIN